MRITRVLLFGLLCTSVSPIRAADFDRPTIRKLGTIDVGLVEATPVAFKDRLYRFEYVRREYHGNTTGDTYFRFIDVETGRPTSSFAKGFDLGCAYAEGETMWAFGVDNWDGTRIVAFRSEDLEHWEESTALELPGWGLFNTSVCKAGDRYIMAIEVGKPAEVVGVPFTTRFAESEDLKTWKLMNEEHVFTKERYSACPSIRSVGGRFFMTYLEARPGPRYETFIVRSPDLIRWESSPLNPVFVASDEDKTIANPKLSVDQQKRIRDAVDLNNSDVDFCEHHGKTIILYSWGNQQGTEFLAEAIYEGSLENLLRGFFP